MEILKMYETEISSCNILRVAAGTNGLKDGDSGHGSRTIIEIEDRGGTNINFKITPNMGNGLIEIRLGGDTELETIIQAFEFIVRTLKRQVDKEAQYARQ